MSDLDREIEEARKRPISNDEALEKIKAIQERVRELDSQKVTIRYNPSPLSALREKYIRPMLETIRRINGK